VDLKIIEAFKYEMPLLESCSLELFQRVIIIREYHKFIVVGHRQVAPCGVEQGNQQSNGGRKGKEAMSSLWGGRLRAECRGSESQSHFVVLSIHRYS